ncbi:hypothetical protein WL29_21265 [Burkholderia ubonensis]|uniref:Uncharacterized protein n=1 Tax=Burkholderia ubonensis TaxID=101571 RepID=A0A106QCR8_9BURK|nr:hypothetical protein [Burkholderia ubonensis]KWA83898.1 hypothetical protein WL29_21265 [Burkholderia ubonensis]
MSKTSSRRRVGRPLRAVPRVSHHHPLATAAVPAITSTEHPGTRKLLITKTVMGMTVNRYQDGYEVIEADGRTFTAPTAWGIFVAMLKGFGK